MFLSQYLVFKIVLAAVTGGRIAYPTAADLVLKYDSANKLFLSGGAGDHVSDMTLFKDGMSYDLGIGEIINKTTTTAYEVALPANSGHSTFGINQDATRYVHQYPVADGYQNGKIQVYSGTPSGGYTTYGSEIQPFNGDEVIYCSMSADGKYIMVTTYNGGNDGYKIYKDNGSSYAYHSAYPFIGSYTSSGYTPAFVPSNNNFVITGTNNNTTWHFKLYVYDSSTETWTAKAQVTPSGSSTADVQRGQWGKGFTYDGSYFFMNCNGVTTRGEVWSVDWTANTMTYKWHTEEGNDGDGAGGAISPDNRYVVLCRHDGNPYRVYENTTGDWSTVVNVTSQFDLTGSGTSTVFGSYGINFSGYSSKNTTPLYIGQFAGLYGDGKFRLENWSKKSPYQIYINKTGKYSADLKICGLDYKTNEVDVTSVTIPAKVVQVISGGMISMALTEDGFVYAWGYDTYGQMGQGTTDANVNTPVKVKGVGGSGFLSNITKISCSNHCLALASDGTLYSWGQNDYGGLGDASTTERKTPVEVSYSGDPVSNISAGENFSALSTTTGKVYCWGLNNSGQIGDNSTTNRNTPTQVVGVGNSGTLAGIRDVSCGDGFTHAIKDSDGSVYGWGKQQYGMLGNNANSGSTKTPVSVILAGGSAVTGITQVCGGGDFSLYLKTDGTVYAAGYGASGQLGDGATANNDTGLVQVHKTWQGAPSIIYCTSTSDTPASQESGYSFKRYPTADIDDYIVYALNDTGNQYNDHLIAWRISTETWVDGDDNSIGDGNSGDQEPVTVNTWSTNSNYIENTYASGVKFYFLHESSWFSDVNLKITQIAALESHSLALRQDGTMYSWGTNTDGQNGLGTVGGTNPTTPVAITLLTGVDTIGGEGKGYNFIASKSDGSVFCWGRGDFGQIGDGTNTADQGTPTQVLPGAGPSVGGKFNLFTQPSLSFDDYNKLSVLHGLSSLSSRLNYGSNVYDIGTVTSDITIEKPGEYVTLTKDAWSNVAYFSNVTVSSVASTQKDYDKQDQVLNAGGDAGYGSGGDASQGGYGNSIDMSADGTRMVVGNAHYTDSNGRVWLYHLENGSWVLKQTWDGGTRLGSQVAMNEAGTRVFAVSPQKDSQNLGFVRIWDYSSGAWDTSASGTYSIAPGTISQEAQGVDCNKAGDVVIIGSGNSNNTWIYRLSGGSWSSEKNFSRRGSGVSMNGDGTRCFMGDRDSHKVWESNYSSGSWGTETEIIDESSFSGYWPASLSTDSTGETLCIKGGDSGNGAIYEQGSGDFNASSQPGLGSISGATQFNGDTFALVPSKSTSTKLYYEPWTDATTHAITVTKSGSNYVINVNDTGATGNPANVSAPGGSAASTATVSAGDTVTVYDSTGNSGTFTMPTLYGPAWSASVSGILSRTEVYGTDKVALSYDGTVAIFGHMQNPNALSTGGHAILYTKSGSTWSIAQTLLNPSDSQHSTDYFGSGTGLAKTAKDRFVVAAMGDDNAGTNYGAIYTYTNAIPKYLDFDTYNKLSISSITPISTTLTYFSDTYDIGTATNIYIESAGTYDAAITASDKFALVSNVVSGTLTSPPDYTDAWGGEHAGMIVDRDGKLYTWGNNNHGESGRGASDRTPTHLSTISDPVSNVWMEGGPARTRVVKTSTDKWYMWGLSGSETLVFGDTSAQVTAPKDVTSYFTTYFGAQGASDSTRIIKVVISRAAFSALAANGKVWSWGKDENNNELGNNTNTTTTTPFKNTTDGSTELSDIVDIGSLHYGKIALDSNGDVWLWGQLRTGSTSRPTKQTGLDSITITGIGSGFFTAYAWDAAGNIYSVGQGSEGQLLNGSTSNQDSTWQTVTTLQGQTIYKIHAEGYQVLIHSSGGIYVGGHGSSSRLGIGSDSDQSTLVKNTTLSALNIHKIAYGNYFGFAITTDGKGYAWGGDAVNSIPTPLSGNQTTPVEASSITNLPLVLQVPSLDFDTYNKLSISGITPTSTTLKYGSITYDLGTISNVYIANPGTYSAEIKGATNFALSSNVTGTVTQVDKYDYSLSSSGQQKITASDAASSDHFGRRCAISGDKMIVTASSENSYQGAAYIFTKSGTTWSQQQKLTGSGLSSTGDPQFGHGADISGNYAIVGAYEEDTDATNAGGAYIYYFSGGTWAQQARIVSSDVASYDEFGLSVGIDGDYVISGANSGTQRPGSAYIFKRSGTSWSQQAKLQASDGATGDRFGKTVALSGDYAVIGAYNDNSGAGSAYIFKKDTGAETWTQQQKLTASDAAASDYFGDNVSMSGDYVIIGARGDGSETGAAYIFKKDAGAETWTQQAKLTASDAAGSDNFGWSVSIDGDLTIIGSLFDDDGGSGSGSAYVFARDGTNWSQQVKLTASDAAASDVFGNSVAIDGDFAVVGARGDGSETGAAYIFQGVNSIPKLDFDGYNKLTISDNSSEGQLWPPSDGTWNITTNTSTLSEWAISGASYGNGSYKATSSVATNGIFRAYQAFEGTESGNTSAWQILATAGILSIEFPYEVVIDKYALLNRNYNVSEDEDASPKDFTFEGSFDGSTWVTLDTVTGNGYYTAEGTASQQTFTISNTTAYKHYRLNVTANNGDSSGTVVGELKLLAVNNSTNLKYLSNTYDIGTATNIYIDKAGTYEAESKGTTTFALTSKAATVLPTSYIAFHHGAFSASDYSSAYSTVGAAATAGHVYSDTTPATYTWGTLNSVDTSTTGQTGYSWTPTSDITADVLMVAGGGGGSDSNGGGGGAGGLVYNASQTLSGQKTIVVGAGGTKGVSWHDSGTFAEPGKNTSFSGLDTAIGGGAGTQYTNYPDSGTRRNGGSGGGAAGSSDNTLDAGGTGTSGQGNAGGGGKRYSGGGGGGAGGAGGNGVYGGNSGSGGVGLDYSSVFGTTYGEDGWFAGGGAGAKGGTASGGKGGGGDGGDATGLSRVAAQAHTGGGGSGGDSTTYPNSDGGSGIVIIRSGPSAPPSLTFDGYKLVVKNITPTSTKIKYFSNTYEIGSATNIYVENTGAYTAEIGNATDFVLTNTTVSGTIKTIEPGFASRYEGSMALTYDGKLYAWGENSEGEAGVGTSSDITVPTLCTGITQGTVAKLLRHSELTDGSHGQVSAIKTTDGKIYMAGKGDNFCIPGETSDQTSFTDVTSYFGDQSLTANTVTMMSFTDASGAALTETGNVWTWGTHDSTNKRLGQAGASSSSTPKQINFSSATGTITKITSGHRHNLALDSSGNVWFWGKNNINSDSWPSSITDEPQKVVDGKNIIGLASGYGTMYAFDATGKMWNAGNNWEGQIGDGTTTTSSTGKTLTEVTYFSSKNITINKVYGGGYFTFADTSDGYYCWGNGGHGVFGNGSTGSLTSGPVKWTHVSNIKKFMASTQHTTAITEDGKYYAWGRDNAGQRGDSDSSSDISYPKYIDALPNILAPSFEFDGYDKVFVGGTFVYEFFISVKLDGDIHNEWILYGLTTTSGILTSSMLQIHPTITGGAISDLFNGNYTGGTYVSITDGNHEVGTKMMTLTTPFQLADITFYTHRPIYQPGYKIVLNGHIILNESTNAGTSTTPSPTSFTKTLQSVSLTKFTKYTKGTTTYDVGKASLVTVSDPGTYDAQLYQGGVFSLKSTTVPATKTTGLYTWAFHHGNFDNAYGDGDILTARDNGRFYADTPAYTSASIGIITPSPSLTPTYTFTISAGATSNTWTWDGSDSAWPPPAGQDEGNLIYSGQTARWQAQDFAGSTYGESPGQFNPGILGVANYGPYDIQQTEADEDSHITFTNNEWSITQGNFTWKITRLNGSMTSSNTTYTFAPPSGGLTANVMMVAGGGGGGGRHAGGGGGAGGLVYTVGTSLANGATKTIVVGNGDSGGYGEAAQNGYDGKDTTFTGLTTADGGGGGGNSSSGTGVAGGSGGGGGGSGSGGAAASGSQGTAGGASSSGSYGGGGGGAGAAGSDYSGDYAGDGGTGKFFGTGSSFTDFGDEYGEGGYFAGGGAGGSNGAGSKFGGTPGRGGGGYGGNYYGYRGINDSEHGGSQHALPHTGSGGGGTGTADRDSHPGYDTTGNGGVKGHGGRGGSGIVLIQTNVAPPNGANTAVVQVGHPRRRSLPIGPYGSNMFTGSEVNRFFIIDSASMPTYKLPTHWYVDPIGSNSNSTWSTHGSHSLQKRADGGTSNVFYVTSTEGLFEYGNKMAQSADAVFMPVEQQRYNGLLAIGSNSADDIHFEMAADGTAKLYRGNGATLLSAGTITCFTLGKWHHIALTVDSGGNAVGYVNGYPVVSGTHTSVAAVGSRSGNMHMRVGDHSITFRKFLTYEVSTYNFHMSPKQVLQRAAEVGLGPKLEYDGLNAINVVNTEPNSSIKIYEQNTTDTSNLYVVACNTSSYTLSNAATYYAEIKGTETYTITRPLTVSDDVFPLYQYPPTDGTTSSLTGATAANSFNNIWTISGAAKGNGQYQVKCNTAADNNHYNAWRNNVGSTEQWQTPINPTYPMTFTIQLPSAKKIRKYRMFPLDHANPNGSGTSATPGTSVDPTLPGNGGDDATKRPKSWVIRGSNNDSDWTDLDTVTNKPISIYGDVYSIDSPASYLYYQVEITANNGGNKLLLGDIQLWGDA